MIYFPIVSQLLFFCYCYKSFDFCPKIRYSVFTGFIKLYTTITYAIHRHCTAITTHGEHFAHKFPLEPQFHRTGHNSSVFYTFYIVKADAYDIY